MAETYKKTANASVSPPSASSIDSTSDLDKAYNFIQNVVTVGNLDTDSVDIKAIRRRVDFRLIPIMLLCYVMQTLDKVNINYAAVMGFNKDLNLKGNNFSDASTAFYVALVIAEIPNGYILQKLPAGKWLGCNVIAWGIVTACIAGTKNYQTLLVGRIFLGIFEASISPSLMLLTSQWYTRSEAASRFQFWFFGMPIAQFIGGLISFGFQHIGPGHLAGWRIMFIALGMVTITIGVAAIFLLPDSPMAPAVKWLSEVEKVALLLHISDNRTGVENRHFKVSQLVELLFDVQIWLMGLIIILITISSGVINSYSVTVIKQFGYTSKEAALLNMPTGAVSGLFTLLVGFGTRHTSHRWAWLILCCIFGVLGGGLMSYAPRHNKGALLTGVYLVNAVVPTPIIIYQLAMSNIAGHTKRAVSAVVVAGCLGIGNIIGPQTFRAKDAPEYHSAKVIVLAVQSAGASVTAVLFLYYVWANKQKERRQRILEREGVAMNTTADTWGNLTDKQNPEFRYVY